MTTGSDSAVSCTLRNYSSLTTTTELSESSSLFVASRNTTDPLGQYDDQGAFGCECPERWDQRRCGLGEHIIAFFFFFVRVGGVPFGRRDFFAFGALGAVCICIGRGVGNPCLNALMAAEWVLRADPLRLYNIMGLEIWRP